MEPVTADMKFCKDCKWRAENERQEEALYRIVQWCRAYPETVFSEPDFDKARTALESAGVSMDALHGTWARHLLKGIDKIASEALAK